MHDAEISSRRDIRQYRLMSVDVTTGRPDTQHKVKHKLLSVVINNHSLHMVIVQLYTLNYFFNSSTVNPKKRKTKNQSRSKAHFQPGCSLNVP